MSHYSKGVDTRNIILHHSLDLFSSNGYDATSVAQICHRAKVSKGAFYYHFPSKQDLFLALMTSWLDEVDGMFQSASDLADNVPEAFGNMAQISGQLFEALKGGFPILLEFWTQASRQPVFWEQAVAPYRRFLDFFASIIKAGIDEGTFEESLDPEPTARIVMAVAMGLMLQATFDPADTNWQEVTQLGIRMILSGMRRIE